MDAALRTFTASHRYLDDDPTVTASDIYPIGLTLSDNDGDQNTASTSVTVKNASPKDVVIDLDIQDYVFALGTPKTFRADFSDVGTLDTHTAVWTFSHVVGLATIQETRPGTVVETNGNGVVENSFVFDNDAVNKDGPGVYTVTLTVIDDDSGMAVSQDSRTFVVYDPSGGFVTGGGWINSAAGSYAADETLAGKATFGFVSKYQKGANVPTGETEFQFKSGNLNFHSSVIARSNLVVVNDVAGRGILTVTGRGTFSSSGSVNPLAVSIESCISMNILRG